MRNQNPEVPLHGWRWTLGLGNPKQYTVFAARKAPIRVQDHPTRRRRRDRLGGGPWHADAACRREPRHRCDRSAHQPAAPRRRAKSVNIYIVRRGEGTLTIEGETHLIRTDDVVYIPAGTRHSLSNLSVEPLELFEIYAPSGERFDFVVDEE